MNFIFNTIYIPLGLWVLGFLLLISSFLNIEIKRKVVLKKRTKNKNRYSNLVINVMNYLEKYDFVKSLIDKTKFNLGYFSDKSESVNREKAKKLIFNIAFLNLILMLLVIIFTENLLAKIVIIVFAFVCEYAFITMGLNNKKKLLKKEFPEFLREYIEGYILKHNVRDAFIYSKASLSSVYQVNLNRLINQMNSLTDSEDAFRQFDLRVNYQMCSNFLNIINNGLISNSNILENLLELQSLINAEESNNEMRKTKLVNNINSIYIYIVACIVTIVLAGRFCGTETGNYFLTTQLGQMLLIVNLIAFAVALIVRKVIDIDDK